MEPFIRFAVFLIGGGFIIGCAINLAVEFIANIEKRD